MDDFKNIQTCKTTKQRSSSSAFKAQRPSLEAREHQTTRVSSATASALDIGKA